jgi:hypothetical protein
MLNVEYPMSKFTSILKIEHWTFDIENALVILNVEC